MAMVLIDFAAGIRRLFGRDRGRHQPAVCVPALATTPAALSLGSAPLVGRRQKLVQAWLIAAITGGLFCAVEFGLRLVFTDKIIEAKIRHELLQNTPYRFDPQYIVGLKPSVAKRFERSALNGGAIVHWRTNSQGYRGPEFQSNPDVRVVVYGDSNVQAVFSDWENTFTSKLQSYLGNLSKRNIEVINGGVVGSGPDQSLIRIGLQTTLLHPDIIVMHVFADNDFGDLLRNQLFELDAAGDLRKTDREIILDSELIDHSGDLMIVRAARKVGKFLFGSLPAGDTADDQIKTLLLLSRQEFDAYKRRKDLGISHFADHYDIDVAIDPDSEIAREKITLMRAVLRQASAVAKRNGAWFMVLVQPSAIDMTESQPVSFRHLQRFPKYDRLRLTRITDDICRSVGIPYLDLWPAFEANQPELMFFRWDDNHWTDAGQDLAARGVARYVFDERLAKMGTQQ